MRTHIDQLSTKIKTFKVLLLMNTVLILTYVFYLAGNDRTVGFTDIALMSGLLLLQFWFIKKIDKRKEDLSYFINRAKQNS